jgi:hypothetical protein
MENKRAKDWWIDTPYGPDGNGRTTGPVDDDNRPVLVINRAGFSRERYLADNVHEYIMEAKDVGATDVWVDIGPNLHSGKQLRLCKSDTTTEERDGLIARGFQYLDSRCDLMYFIEPEEPVVERQDDYSESKLLFYPTSGVRIKIVRDMCMCSSYHKEPKPGAFDYSQVALTGAFVRPPPVQRDKTPEELAHNQRIMRKAHKASNRLRVEAAAGSGRATFLLALADMARNVRAAATESVSDQLTTLNPRQN